MYLDGIKPHIHMPPSFLISVLIVAFLWPILPPAGVRGSDPYEGCGDSFDCGNRTGIGYPFWLSGWPKYCGHPSFALECEGGNLSLSYGKLSYRVNDIDASAQILKVQGTKLLSSRCAPEDIRNTSFDTSVFAYTPSDSFVYVLYGCDPPDHKAQGGTTAVLLHQFTCTEIDNNFVAISQQPPEQALTGRCDSVIQVPVMNTSKILKGDFSDYAMAEAFVNGFEIHWIDENTGKCEACWNSNGTCIYKPDLEEWKCRCHDGTISKTTCRSRILRPASFELEPGPCPPPSYDLYIFHDATGAEPSHPSRVTYPSLHSMMNWSITWTMWECQLVIFAPADISGCEPDLLSMSSIDIVRKGFHELECK